MDFKKFIAVGSVLIRKNTMLKNKIFTLEIVVSQSGLKYIRPVSYKRQMNPDRSEIYVEHRWI